MQKQAFFSVTLAVLSIAALIYIRTNQPIPEPAFPSIDHIAKSQSEGLQTFFGLSDSEKEKVYQLYKNFETVRIPREEKLAQESRGNYDSTTYAYQELSIRGDAYYLEYNRVQEDLIKGMQAILNESQFKQWKHRDLRSKQKFKNFELAEDSVPLQ